MKTTLQHFAASLAILAMAGLFVASDASPAWSQIGGGGNNQGGNNQGGNNQGGRGGGGGNTGGGGGGGSGGGGSPLEFDAGVTLDRTERRGRDAGAFVGSAAPSVGDFNAAEQGGAGGAGGRGQQNPLMNFFQQSFRNQ